MRLPEVHGGRRLAACVLGLVLTVAVAPAQAGYQAGLDAYEAGDFATAMSEWKQTVKQDPDSVGLAVYREALFGIGVLHFKGEGVPQDFSVAAVWLKQAADINHPGAQTKLGYLYSTGQGVPQNYAEAARWFQMAAAQGDPDARYNLDYMASEGLLAAPAAVTAGAEEPVPGHDAGVDWVLRQNPEHYTIQVIALSAPDKLVDYIAEQPDWSPFAIIPQTRFERPLWVLVQGVYATVEAARVACDAFPPGLQERSELWVRQFGRVQRLVE